MFEFEKGMICLLEVGLVLKAPNESESILFEPGTPVKIVEIVDPKCAAVVSGECQAPCRGACCPRSVVVEDCNGKLWMVKPDIEDGEFPLISLDKGDPEMLLSRKDWRLFKLAKWTDEGILSKYQGPFNVMGGVMGMSLAKAIPEPWGLVVAIAFGLLALYGAVFFAAGNKYRLNPLPYGQILFYRNYERNKASLEALLQKCAPGGEEKREEIRPPSSSENENAEALKQIVWKWDKNVFVPYCPHCDDLVYEKDHCAFCHQPYEWVDPEKPASGGWPSADIALVNSGEWTIHLPNPDFKRVYLLKNNRLLMTAPCNKKMTKAELLQFLSDNVERLEKRYQELYPENQK